MSLLDGLLSNNNGGGTGNGNFRGPYSALTDTPALANPPTSPDYAVGDYWQIIEAGTRFGITFAVGDLIKVIQDGANLAYAKEVPSGVQSVTGNLVQTAPDAKDVVVSLPNLSNVAYKNTVNTFTLPQGYQFEDKFDVAGNVNWDPNLNPAINVYVTDNITIKNFSGTLDNGERKIALIGDGTPRTITFESKYKFAAGQPPYDHTANEVTVFVFEPVNSNLELTLASAPTQQVAAVNADQIADGSVSNAQFQTLSGINIAGTIQDQLDNKAPLASPALTGTPTAPTPATNDNTTKIATTAFSQALVAALKLNQIGAPDSSVDLNSQKIINLASPVNDNDAVNFSTAKAIANGQVWLPVAADYTTTGDITLSGLTTQTNGTWPVTLTAGTLVWVWQQTNQAENGLYVAASGAWSRSSYADTWNELLNKRIFINVLSVNNGTQYSGWSFQTVMASSGVLGTDPINIVPASNGAVEVSSPLAMIGQTIYMLDSGVGVGTYGSADNVIQLTIDQYGRITNALEIPIQIDKAAVMGLGTMASQNANNIAVSGGSMAGVTLDNTNSISAAAINSGTLTDARLSSNIPLKNAVNTYGKQQVITPQVINPSATLVTVDLDTSPIVEINLDRDIILNVSNIRAGGRYCFKFKQDVTGNRTVSYISGKFKFGTITPTLSATGETWLMFDSFSSTASLYCWPYNRNF